MAKIPGDERWKDLDITKDEVDRIGKALKNEEFRKMFLDYAQEISDPKNREIYENEIAQMESERGMDVQFIHPQPGHVVKVMAVVPGTPDKCKVFINICHNEALEKPTHEKTKKPNGNMGLHWSIPHSFSPAREDIDKKGEKYSVYDVVFHPDTYKMSSNPAFLKMLHETAIEGLEAQFGLKIDNNSLVKLTNLKFKGRVEPTVMRKRKADGGESAGAKSDANKENDPLANFPYPYEKGVTSEELAKRKAKEVEEASARRSAREANKKSNDTNNNSGSSEQSNDSDVITPRYTITNQYGMDMSDYSQSLTGTPMPSVADAPSNLVISIHLPKLKSAKPCELDVTERHLSLESSQPAAYKLDMKLPYPVDDENGSAKFDKTKKQLVVTLPVRKDKILKEMQAKSEQIFTAPGNGDSSAISPQTNGVHINGDVSNEDIELSASPLIQELSSTSTTEEYQVHQPTTNTQQDKHDAEDLKDNSTGIQLDNKVDYKVPKFTQEQDDDSITLVLEVARVKTDTFKSAFHENVVEMIFSSFSPSGFPSHYYMKCEFPSPVKKISRSIGQTNVVISIIKQDKQCWDSFMSVDQHGEHQQERKFISQTDIRKELQELEEKSAESDGIADAPLPEHRPAQHHLTVDIQAAKEAAPVVVHKHSPPDIPGILKRTVSESSADEPVNSSSGDCYVHQSTPSPNSSSSDKSNIDLLPSPRERKKSVSFSDKVEETMFKAKEAVCVMHKMLANRRKKQRQREHRKEDGTRDRRNSSTDYSSSEEQLSKKSGGRRRRRRNSSGSGSVTSDDGDLSPRSPITDPLPEIINDHDDEEGVCTCTPDTVEGAAKESKATSHDLSVSDQSKSEAIKIEPGEKPSATKEAADNEVLNSDDDDDESAEQEQNSTKTNNCVNWSETSEIVEKTQCAFDFSNSVIFDLDE